MFYPDWHRLADPLRFHHTLLSHLGAHLCVLLSAGATHVRSRSWSWGSATPAWIRGSALGSRLARTETGGAEVGGLDMVGAGLHHTDRLGHIIALLLVLYHIVGPWFLLKDF